MLVQTLIALVPIASAAAMALEPRAAPTEIGFSYPPLRGWSSETASVAPCGGYKLGGRTNFPLTGGDISLALARDANSIRIGYSALADPQSLDDFQGLVPNITQAYSGSQCVQAPDFATLGLAVGSVVTFQVAYQTGPKKSNLFQCADVTLVATADFVPASEYTCANVTRSTQTTGNGNTAAVSSEAAVETRASTISTGTGSFISNQKVSPLASGFIGAAVAIVVCLLAFAALFTLGYAKFGKKNVQAINAAEHDATTLHDDSSMVTRGSMHKSG